MSQLMVFIVSNSNYKLIEKFLIIFSTKHWIFWILQKYSKYLIAVAKFFSGFGKIFWYI